MLCNAKREPLYERVKRELLDYIDREKSSVLPSEKKLMIYFGVSRNTLRHAISDLTKAGIVKPVQGRGSVVLKYAGDRIADIGVVCTDAVDITDPWVARILQTLRHLSHAENYHLNLFFCHDYAIGSSTNSAYSYLMNSGKLAGLILISSLQYTDIAHIKNIGLPAVTVDFKYRDFDYPAFVPDCVQAIMNFVDIYATEGLKRFALIAKKTTVLEETDCSGLNELIIKQWPVILSNKNLPVVPHDFKLDVIMQLKAIYALPAAERPQVVFTPSIAYGKQTAAFLAELTDWRPLHITSEIRGHESGEAAIIIDPAMYAQQAFITLNRIITEKENGLELYSQPAYGNTQLAGIAV